MSRVSHRIDRIDTTFDNPNLAADGGLILAGTLTVRLGLEALVNAWVRTGSPQPGSKVTVVSAMLAGATHIPPQSVRGVTTSRGQSDEQQCDPGSHVGGRPPPGVRIRNQAALLSLRAVAALAATLPKAV